MTSKSPVRSCEDLDESALSYAEVKALATGNPMIKEKMDLDIQVSKLKLLKANHDSQRYRLEDHITNRYPKRIRSLESRLEAMGKDLDHYLTEKRKKFSIKIKGVQYTEKKEAGKKILELCQCPWVGEHDVGEYRGFRMSLLYSEKEVLVKLRREMAYTAAMGSDAYGNVIRIDHLLEGIQKEILEESIELQNVKKQLESAKEAVKTPFEKEEELVEKIRRLSELNLRLNLEHSEPENPIERIDRSNKARAVI